jgi:hypothetical protein
MSYTVKIYLDSEKIPDETYFTREIFLATCLNNTIRIAVARGVLTSQLLDEETKEVVCKTLDTIIENQKAILQGGASGQITFLNKSKGGEELNEPIRE